MKRAFVLSGGANLGAAQVGMLLAMERAAVAPDLVVGTSVGALNGAWVAGRASIEELADLWRSLHRRDVFPADPLRGFLGFLGQRDHLVGDRGIRRILRGHLQFDRIEEAAIPFHVVATDVLSGEGALFSSGPALEAILASSAIPGVLPTVAIGGRAYMDGGVVNNTPISHAVDLGADAIYVLATGHSCALAHPPRGALGLALHAATLVIHQRLAFDIDRYAGAVDLRVVPPLCPISVSPTDFSQADSLISGAFDHTTRWLETVDQTPLGFLSGRRDLEPHRHDAPAPHRP